MKGHIAGTVRVDSETLGSKKQPSMFALTRRGFLSGAALMGSAFALTACGPQNPTESAEKAAPAEEAKETHLKDTYRVGMEAAYAPYNWQTETESDTTIPIDNVSGAYADGYDVAIAKRLGEAMGAEMVAVKMSFSGLIDALNQGQIDMIIAGMSETPERAQSISFSDPYYVGSYGMLVRKGSKYESATSLADFAGAAVLGQKDTLLDEVIDEIPDVNHVTPVDSVPAQIANLEQGTCDAITYEAANMTTILKTHPDLAGVVFEKGKGFKDEIFCNVGIAKDADDLLQAVNDALETISQEERDQLYQEAMERQPA